MIDDTRLYEDLRALAEQVRGAPLDLAALQATARTRRRRRRLVLAVPVVLLALGGLLVLPALRPAPDRLAVAPGDPVRIVTAATLRPAVEGITVRPALVTTPVVGHRTEVELVWTVDTARAAAPYSAPAVLQEVRADAGPGVIGIAVGQCADWDDLGRRVDHSCPAPVGPEPLTTGSTTGFRVSDVVPTGHMATGTYRFALDVGRLGSLDVVLQIRGTQRPPTPSVPVTGTVVAVHGRGVVQVGAGPVPATLTFARVLSDDSYTVTTTDGRWSTTLPPGDYQVLVTITDGSCPGGSLEVVAGRPTSLDISCQDGRSTF